MSEPPIPFLVPPKLYERIVAIAQGEPDKEMTQEQAGAWLRIIAPLGAITEPPLSPQ